MNEISPVIKPRTGSYLLKMFLPNNLVSTTGSGNKVNTYQQVYLEAGTTYVFSGYVNSSGMTSFGRDGGLSLSFQNSSGTDVAESNRLNYATSNQVENGWTRLEVTYTPQTSGNYRVSANMKNAAKFAAFDDFQLEKVVIPAEDMPAEKQGVASSANLVQLGGLERWSASGASSSEVSKYWTYDGFQGRASAVYWRRRVQRVRVPGARTSGCPAARFPDHQSQPQLRYDLYAFCLGQSHGRDGWCRTG